ncbi:MAG: winged helix-turn-helix transcriptional regulator [Methylovulum sp.]|nr:winged helix-turn-helix transcriptional regulator [Methylovulum sp.]
MAEKVGSRQQQILKLLLENKAGLSIDEVAAALDISRNAVQQHFTALERDGYIQTGGLNKTAGRPVRAYILTEAGINCFPKQYAWFSELIVSSLKEEMGSEAFKRYLHKLGTSLSQSLLPQFEGKPNSERMAELLKVMAQLGFQAKAVVDSDDSSIEACNCIYHELAQKHEEICEFDRALITSLLDKDIDHVECMAKGGAICRFKIIKQSG